VNLIFVCSPLIYTQTTAKKATGILQVSNNAYA